MSAIWQQRAEQWRRFSAWEAARLREAPPSLEEALAWMSDAYDLAKRSDPDWGSSLDLEHVRHIQRMRAALSLMKLP